MDYQNVKNFNFFIFLNFRVVFFEKDFLDGKVFISNEYNTII